jgi:hypothetical protein
MMLVCGGIDLQEFRVVELSWPIKLRIAAASAVGVFLIGILAWPLGRPAEPLGAVSVVTGCVSLGDAAILVVLAFVAGCVGYFVSWPYGREIGILAAPAGLAVWAVRSGSMTELIRQNATIDQRVALFSGLKWESPFWLAVVAAGYAGAVFAQNLVARGGPSQADAKPRSKENKYINCALALIGSALIALLCIKLLARDVTIGVGSSVVAQPLVAQIVLAVFVSFGVGAFVVKKWLGVGYVWPAMASILVTFYTSSTYGRAEVLQHLVGRWPAAFFANSVVCILPIQMVAFGTFGSIAGYWMAMRYIYWRKHE